MPGDPALTCSWLPVETEVMPGPGLEMDASRLALTTLYAHVQSFAKASVTIGVMSMRRFPLVRGIRHNHFVTSR